MAEQNERFVVTARRLSDGAPLYLRPDGLWSRLLADAGPRPEAAALVEVETRGRTEQRELVDPYLFKVAVAEDGSIDPLSMRERIRSEGPTVPIRRAD